MDEKRSKNTALLVLGVIGVIAVVGLVMMFAQNKKATGAYGWAKIYSNIEGNPYPHYTGRGAPANIYEGNLRTGVVPTQEVNYQGMSPSSPTLGWQGQGPYGPAQTFTFQLGDGSQRLSGLSVQEYEHLNSLYVTKRIGDQVVKLKRYRCGQNPQTGSYWCDSLVSSTV